MPSASLGSKCRHHPHLPTSTCHHLLAVLSLLSHLVPVHQHPHEEGGSCVRNISIKESDDPATQAYTYHLHLDSRCPPGRTWRVDVVECGNGGRVVEQFVTRKHIGRVCPLSPGCKRLRMDHTYSRPFSTAGVDLTRLDVSFREFDLETLSLAIASEPRVRAWNLTILRCPPGNKRPHPRRCRNTRVHEVGNATLLRYDGYFLKDYCYYFKLQPLSHDPRCSLRSSISPFPSQGCRTPSSPSPAPSPSKRRWWTRTTIGVVVVCVAVLQGVVTAALCLRCKATRSPIPPTPRSSKWREREVVCEPASVLLLYAREGTTHLTMVTHLTSRLTRLGCHVLDIYNISEVDQLADPCEWLLGLLSASRSSVRVVLVVSPKVTKLVRALLSGHSHQVTEGGPLDNRLHNNLLMAALRRLLEKDLVKNYRRVFVVSLSETEGEAQADIDLLVESRRYCLPLHWQQLTAAILEKQCSASHHAMITTHDGHQV